MLIEKDIFKLRCFDSIVGMGAPSAHRVTERGINVLVKDIRECSYFTARDGSILVNFCIPEGKGRNFPSLQHRPCPPPRR